MWNIRRKGQELRFSKEVYTPLRRLSNKTTPIKHGVSRGAFTEELLPVRSAVK